MPFPNLNAALPIGPRFRYIILIAELTCVAVACSLLRITPKLVPWRDHELVYETTKVEPMLAQLRDPTGWYRTLSNDPYFNGIQTIRWRLLPPIFGRMLHLTPHVYLTLPWLGAAFLIGLVVHYSLLAGASRTSAAGAAILVGTSSGIFSATCAVGYFDPFYLIALLAFTCSPSSAVLLISCLLGPWMDEKFLIMLPACAAARWAWRPDWRWVRLAVFGIVPYCLVRIAALGAGDDSFSRQFAMQAAVFRNYAPALPAGWWYGFRAGWVLVGTGFAFAVTSLVRPARIFLFLSIAAAIGAISFLAWDTTRSIAMVTPFLVLGIRRHIDGRLVLGLAALNLLLPAAYVWCGQPVTVPLKSILFR